MKSPLPTILLLAGLVTITGPARAQETNTDSGLDFKSFSVISQRNIFNPNRTGRRSYVSTGPRVRVDSFTLVGTMSYEKGRYAFFDGTRSEYRKTLKPSETIAGYKIAEIAADHIKLAAASNQTINLPVGTQMRRTDGGPWALAGRATADAYSATPTPAPDTAPAAAPDGASAAESDVMKRLMMKRLSEK